jgi:hypothetical protein
MPLRSGSAYCTYPGLPSLAFEDPKNQKERFNCTSLALGSGILAADVVCGNNPWEQIKYWQESLDETYLRMTIFAGQLDSQLHLRHPRDSPLSHISSSTHYFLLKIRNNQGDNQEDI